LQITICKIFFETNFQPLILRVLVIEPKLWVSFLHLPWNFKDAWTVLKNNIFKTSSLSRNLKQNFIKTSKHYFPNVAILLVLIILSFLCFLCFCFSAKPAKHGSEKLASTFFSAFSVMCTFFSYTFIVLATYQITSKLVKKWMSSTQKSDTTRFGVRGQKSFCIVIFSYHDTTYEVTSKSPHNWMNRVQKRFWPDNTRFGARGQENVLVMIITRY